MIKIKTFPGVYPDALTSDTSEEFIMDHPDPTLEDGQELRLVCGKFPTNLHNVLLEDIDFYYTERGEKVGFSLFFFLIRDKLLI